MKFHRSSRDVRTISIALVLVAGPWLTASAAGLFDSLKKIAGPTEYVVRGRLQTQDGQWLTCFNDIKTGYLGAADLARPGDARLDPTSGQMQISTAAIPAIVMTRTGVVTSNDCDSLASQQLLSLATPPTAATAGDGLIRDKYGCGVWTEEEFRRADKDEIMACQARVITEREAARLQGAAAAAPAPPVAAGAQQAALSKLQADTAAQFAAIQAQAGVAASAPAAPVSAEDLAWDGAKLCQLKPAYMMKLREEATQFVRLDTATDRIVMSELAGGERQEIALDGNTFAQRASFNATAIGQGGDTCGRAFWNAEAYKAASAAFSAPQP
jgi:hypothetical protein